MGITMPKYLNYGCMSSPWIHSPGLASPLHRGRAGQCARHILNKVWQLWRSWQPRRPTTNPLFNMPAIEREGSDLPQSSVLEVYGNDFWSIHSLLFPFPFQIWRTIVFQQTENSHTQKGTFNITNSNSNYNQFTSAVKFSFSPCYSNTIFFIFFSIHLLSFVPYTWNDLSHRRPALMALTFPAA